MSVDTAYLLASHDLRVTQQRVVVLEALMREPNDTTAQALHIKLRADHPSLGLATVYRTLNALADAGVIDRMHHDHAGACFRFCQPGHHHHLTCRECHKIVELRSCDLGDWAQRIAATHGFTSVEHEVELVGVCASCAL